MADSLSITCGVLALVSFALSSAETLASTIHSFQDHNKRTLALQTELIDLEAVLRALLEMINNNPDIDFDALKSPLHRCGNACKEYGELVARFTKHSTANRTSIRGWVTKRYLQGDVTDFKDMLSGYKSTIHIAMANVNIRVAAVTPQALEEYRQMMSDATEDLEQHLHDIEEKMDALSLVGSESEDHQSPDWEAILDEKRCTEQGLEICSQLSAQIERLDVAGELGAQSPEGCKSQGSWKSGLDKAKMKASIRGVVSQLESHQEIVDRRLAAMIPSRPKSKETAEELGRLQATKDSIQQCIRVVSGANEETAEIGRHNVFEDITLADNSYSFTVSTVGDLVTARRIRLSGRSYNVGGQITDEGFQKAVEEFARAGIQPAQDSGREMPVQVPGEKENAAKSEFDDRHGRGVPLAGGANVAGL